MPFLLAGATGPCCVARTHRTPVSRPRTTVTVRHILPTSTFASNRSRRWPKRVVLCRAEEAQPLNLSPGNIISSLTKASSVWDKYDADRSGTLSLEECEALFNSPELREAVQLLTNVPPRHLTAADLEPFFSRADLDRSGELSRTEFLALYLAVATDRVRKNPLVLAEALLGFLDADRNGVLEGGELRALLACLGFAPALLMPIPGFIKVEYRAVLRQLGAGRDGTGGGSG